MRTVSFAILLPTLGVGVLLLMTWKLDAITDRLSDRDDPFWASIAIHLVAYLAFIAAGLGIATLIRIVWVERGIERAGAVDGLLLIGLGMWAVYGHRVQRESKNGQSWHRSARMLTTEEQERAAGMPEWQCAEPLCKKEVYYMTAERRTLPAGGVKTRSSALCIDHAEEWAKAWGVTLPESPEPPGTSDPRPLRPPGQH
jgi:hypothetical protein